MKQPMTGYHEDEEGHWVVKLSCGHFQHVRHNPPWTTRSWVVTEEGRTSKLGFEVNCKKCDLGAPIDE